MLATKFVDHQIILASQSPRRQELLKGLEIDFTIETRPVNEVYDDQLQREEIPLYLSQLKAEAFKEDIKANQIIITADTIVWHKERALGKPQNRQDAIDMLSQLSGSSHWVYSGVCITSIDKQITFSDATEVHIKPLSHDEMVHYVDTHQPFDKAGSYGIQEWLGYACVSGINGSYYNVMGLPLHVLYDQLKQW